jgi:hypothetical protein
MARTGPTLSHRDGALVASSVPVRYVGDDDGDTFARYGGAREALLAAARDGGSDEWGRRARRLSGVVMAPPVHLANPNHDRSGKFTHRGGGGGSSGGKSSGGGGKGGSTGKDAPAKATKAKGAAKKHPGYKTAPGVNPGDASTWPGVKKSSGTPDPTEWEVRPTARDSAWKAKGDNRAIVTGGRRFGVQRQRLMNNSWRTIHSGDHATVERAMADGDNWIANAPPLSPGRQD